MFQKNPFISQNNGLLPSSRPLYINYFDKRVYQTRSANQNILDIFKRTKIFESSFSPCCIKEYSNLKEVLQKTESIVQFKTKIITFMRLKEHSIFKIHDTNGIKLLNSLRLKLSHLNEQILTQR